VNTYIIYALLLLSTIYTYVEPLGYISLLAVLLLYGFNIWLTKSWTDSLEAVEADVNFRLDEQMEKALSVVEQHKTHIEKQNELIEQLRTAAKMRR